MNSEIEKIYDRVVFFRRAVHRLAELSFEEFETQRLICAALDEYGISYRRVAGTGVLAILDGYEPTPDAPLILRADMDALPIVETSGVSFACDEGRMHACGHDMHAASLLGALILLKTDGQGFRGTVWGLFQPGEELHPGGASIVIGEGVFDGVTPRGFVGQHCSPELPTGTVGFCSGQFMASTDELHIKISGCGGHAAMPHLINDTVLAASAVVVALQQIVSRRANAFTPTVVSIGKFVADGATNIVPSEVLLEGTMRTMDEGWRAEVKDLVREICAQTAATYGCTAEVDIRDGYPAVINDDRMTEAAVRLAAGFLGADSVRMISRRMTAEDFGFYSRMYPSLFYRLGVGGGRLGGACSSGEGIGVAPLHNGAFCPDERALLTGMTFMAELARSF